MLLRRLLVTVVCTAILAATVPLVVSAVTMPAEAGAVASTTTVVNKALKYFKSRQQRSGGFTAGGTSAAHMTPWVVMAIRAAGKNPATWRKSGGKTTVGYLQSVDIKKLATSGSPRNPAATYAKYILAYKALRRTDLIRKAGKRRVHLLSKLLAYQNRSNGRFTTRVGGTGSYAAISTTTYAILALKAADNSKNRRLQAARWLRGQAHSSGGFSWNPGGTPDVDSTGAAIQALRACGVSPNSSVIRNALKFMRSRQRSDRGFPYYTGGSTVESTSLAVMGIVWAGQNPTGSAWRKNGRSPLYYLRTKQSSNGSFYHIGRIKAAPLMSTSYAVIALKKKRLPL
jgi:squalene-hopene cyclase-like protein